MEIEYTKNILFENNIYDNIEDIVIIKRPLKYNIFYFKHTTQSWFIMRIYKTKIYPVIRFIFGIKKEILKIDQYSIEWIKLINKTIIDPFITKCYFSKNYMVFDIYKYRSYPLCFWKAVFMKIFDIYEHSFPSINKITQFIQFINTKAFGIFYLSDKIHCTLKLDIMNINFNTYE